MEQRTRQLDGLRGAVRAWRWSLLVATLLALALAVVTTPAQAHFLGYDSVDGREIRYDDSTRFDDARQHAINVWNALGSINIAPDTWSTYADLEWFDSNRSDVNWDGLYTNTAGTDEIYLNAFYLDSYSDFSRRAVAAHEQGHALGLAHSFSGQLMYECSTCSGVNTPQGHDIEDYRALWG